MRWAVASISAGVVGLALAASAPALAGGAPMMAPAYSWTGFYIGANVGAAWGKADVDQNVGVPFSGITNNPITIIVPPQLGAFPGTSGTGTGVIGGGQIGYNWQSDRWVYGVEADFDGTGLKANSSTSVTRGPPALLLGPQTVTANY